VLAKWEVRRERQLKVPPEKRTPAQERALGGTRKVVELFQKMNMAFGEEESGTEGGREGREGTGGRKGGWVRTPAQGRALGGTRKVVELFQ